MSLKTILSLIVLYLASFAVGQEAVQRYYAAKDERAARIGSFYVAGVYLFFAFIPAFLGVSAFAMVEAGDHRWKRNRGAGNALCVCGVRDIRSSRMAGRYSICRP